MKLFLTGLALTICMYVNAQTVLPATAEECIAFIEQTLKATIVEEKDFKTTLYFKGTQVTEDHVYPSGSIYRDSYQNIDWASYKEISRTPNNANTAIVFNFSVPFVKTDQTYYNGTLTNLKMESDDYLLFTIRQSDTARIKDIEMAAARLAQLAREKSSPLLRIKPPKVPIDGKPTYKETASFIKSYFNTDSRKKHNTVSTYWYEGGYLNSLSYKMLYMEISDCILYAGYEVLRTNYFTKAESSKTVTLNIDLAKIEELKVQVTGTRHPEVKEQHFVNNITFKLADNPTTYFLPFDNLPVDAPNNGMDTQIFKAFRQIKKLCGSPEPVVFD